MSRQSMKPFTHGQSVANNVMAYLNQMYPDIMKQSRSFRTSLKNYMASQVDVEFREHEQVRVKIMAARSPIERMVDQACGVDK